MQTYINSDLFAECITHCCIAACSDPSLMDIAWGPGLHMNAITNYPVSTDDQGFAVSHITRDTSTRWLIGWSMLKLHVVTHHCNHCTPYSLYAVICVFNAYYGDSSPRPLRDVELFSFSIHNEESESLMNVELISLWPMHNMVGIKWPMQYSDSISKFHELIMSFSLNVDKWRSGKYVKKKTGNFEDKWSTDEDKDFIIFRCYLLYYSRLWVLVGDGAEVAPLS